MRHNPGDGFLVASSDLVKMIRHGSTVCCLSKHKIHVLQGNGESGVWKDRLPEVLAKGAVFDFSWLKAFGEEGDWLPLTLNVLL